MTAAEARTIEAEVEGSIGRVVERAQGCSRRPAPSQLLAHYRDGPLSARGGAGPVAAGDRVPDVQGLRRKGIGFPLRLLDLLRGPQLVLLTAAPLRRRWPGLVRVVTVATGAAPTEQPVGVEFVHDAAGGFAAAFGTAEDAAWLVRPDKVVFYLERTIGLA